MSKKYIELKEENIIFEGKTEEEKKINKVIYELCLENDKLEQENNELQEALKRKRICYYRNKAYDVKILIKGNEVLIEFEKWLKTRMHIEGKTEIPYQTIAKPNPNKKYDAFEECLNKLQELKGDK